MTILKRIEDAKRLWDILMPHIPQPADAVFGKWCRFPDSAIEAGLVRGSKKFATRKVDIAMLDTAQVYRYIAGVIRHEAEAQKGVTMTQPETKDVTAEMQAELEQRFPDDPYREAARIYVDTMKELAPEQFQ